MQSVQNIAPALNPGDKLGYFEVQSPLAAGGMSLVWKGRDPMLNRDVAIKQLAAAGSIDEVVRDKFRKEVEIQKKASAEHKNLVQVIDYIEESRGLFLVMEYVDGSSLDRALSKLNGPMDPKEALGIMHQVTVGLAAIHQAGVLHRDLKPANILLPRDGGVKICDFGLATLTTEQDALTHGTARYMAPELYSGENADARCDLYSLGFVTYEMLVGRPAFEEAFKTVMRDQRNQALRWMKWHTNQRLSAPAITKLNENVPQEFADIVTRLMDKDPTQRVADAPQLLDVLKRTFSGERPAPQQQTAAAPTEPGFAQTAEKTAPLPQKSKVPMILALVLGVQLLGIGAYFLYDSMKTDSTLEDARSEAMAQLERGRKLYAEEQYKEAGQTLAPLAEQWADDPRIGPSATAGKYMAAAHVKLDQGAELTQEGRYAEAEQVYDTALEALRFADETKAMDRDMIALVRDEVNIRRSFVNIAAKIVSLTEAGDFSEARHQIRLIREKKPSPMEVQILDELASRIEGRSVQARINTVLKRAEELEADEKFDEARALVEQAAKEFASNPELKERYRELSSRIRYQNSLSMARRAESGGNFDEAIRYYREVNNMEPSKEFQDKITELNQKKHYAAGERAERENKLAQAKDEYERALPYPPAKKALERLGEIVGRQSYEQQGDIAMSNNDWTKAIDLFNKAQEIQFEQTTASKIDESKLRQTVDQARAALERGDLPKADELIGKAQKMKPNDRVVIDLHAQLQLVQQYTRLIDQGDESRRAGKFGDALNFYRRALNLITGTNIDKTEVMQRISDTEYDSWMAKGKAAKEARQWRVAYSSFKSAQRQRDTAEVRQELEEVKNNDPDVGN